MPPPSRPALLGLVLALVIGSQAANSTSIERTADVNTECKTCPRSLCPNKLFYSQGDALNVTCWNRGTKIMGDNLWLGTDKGCYVTQYDVSEFDGDYTEALPYCGRKSEEEDLTTEDATIRYKAECRICPSIDCDTWAYLKEDTDVELTCWTPDGQTVIDDPYWMKTTNNCYVSRKHLYSKPDITYLDSCGPIPYLETEKHWNENGTSEIDAVQRRDADEEAEVRHVEEREILRPRYLINVTVGEDFADCHEKPDPKSHVEKRYKFDQEVWLQCVTEQNGTWWSETTDFCYVDNKNFWQSPEGDYYRNPLCENFGDLLNGDGSGSGSGGNDQ